MVSISVLVSFWYPLLNTVLLCLGSLILYQDQKLANIEKTSLRIILQDNYVSYEAALEMCGLTSLSERRASHLLAFARSASCHPVHGHKMFPRNPGIQNINAIRNREVFQVNFSRGAVYYNSTIPMAHNGQRPTTG